MKIMSGVKRGSGHFGMLRLRLRLRLLKPWMEGSDRPCPQPATPVLGLRKKGGNFLLMWAGCGVNLIGGGRRRWKEGGDPNLRPVLYLLSSTIAVFAYKLSYKQCIEHKYINLT